jgi:hypothetical protein
VAANGAVAAATGRHRSALDEAIARLVVAHGGPPGIAVIVDRGEGSSCTRQASPTS